MIRMIVITALLAWAVPLAAQEVREVRFAPGEYGTMVEGSVPGGDYLDYTLEAGEGQRLFAEIDSGATAYFNLLPPGSQGEAIFIGSRDGDVADLALPEAGTYTVRVYQMGNAADTGQVTPFTLDISIQ